MDVHSEFSASQPIAVPPPSPTVSPVMPKPSRFKKVVKVLLSVLLIFLIFLTLVVIYLDHRDLPSVDQSGLTLDNPQVPNSENMIFDLEKLNLSSTTDTTSLTSTLAAPQLDTAAASKMIQGNEAMISSFLLASQKPFFQEPLTAHPPFDTTKTTQVGTILAVARIVCLDARVKAQTPAGLAEAHDELAAVLKVGNRMGNGQGTIREYSVAQAILKMGYQAVNILGIKDPNFLQYADTVHGAYLSQAVEYYANIDGIKDIITIASSLSPEGSTGNPQIDYILKHYKYDPLKSFYYQPIRTRQTIINTTVSAINYSITDCSSKATFSSPDFPFPADTWRAYLTDNLIGKFILSNISTFGAWLHKNRCEVETLSKQ